MSTQQVNNRIQAHALRLLAAREYTRAEMHARLLRWLQRNNRIQTHYQIKKFDDIANNATPCNTNNHSANAIQIETLNQVLNKLEKMGLLNDQRAAEALVRRKSARFGIARMRHELKNKGVDAELASQVVDDLQQSETARAYQVWQKKYGILPQNPKEYASQMRFLANRGFAADAIHKILRGMIDL